MQTFLPFPSFRQSAQVLDSERLWKQLVEAGQIFTALHDLTYGWQQHPAKRMWHGYSGALYRYAAQVYYECVERRINAHEEFAKLTARVVDVGIIKQHDFKHNPFWLGDPAFHRSHQSSLLRKAYCFYVNKFPGVPTNLPYVWPDPMLKYTNLNKLTIKLFPEKSK